MVGAPVVVSSDEMTFEEYLVAYDGVHAEWVDQRVWPKDAEGARHSLLRRFIATVLQLYAEHRDAGEVYVAPFTVRLSDLVAREPDVFFVGRRHAGRVHSTHVEGAPDLVVEIPGPESRGRVRGDAWFDYEAAGVPEFWLVDPDRKVVEAWRLGTDGRYDVVSPGTPAVLRSEVLEGLPLPVSWLWREPLPTVREVQKAWGLVDAGDGDGCATRLIRG